MTTVPDIMQGSSPAGSGAQLENKLARLQELLRSYGTVALGYSGGVDSTFLAAVLARCMPEQALLVHLASPFVGTPERSSFEREGARFGLPVLVLDFDPLSDDEIRVNPANRCYHCKHAGFARVIAEARAHGYQTVIEGSNADDPEDSRPGTRAMRELGVCAPLREAGWHKAEERELLRAWGIATWNMPADACLATRLACGEPLTLQKLELVRRCEDYLHERGLARVRARLAEGRICVQAASDDLQKLASMAGGNVADDGSCPLPESVAVAFRSFGAQEVAPRATPYRYGSMSGLASA